MKKENCEHKDENKCECNKSQCECDNAKCEDNNVADSNLPSGKEELITKLEVAEKDVEKYKDLYLRAVADLDTLKRRVLRDREEILKFAAQPFAEGLIPVIDNFKIALSHMNPDSNVEDISKGVDMILSQLLNTFKDFGIKEINPLNEEFDPKVHDCVSHEPSENVAENKVSKVIRSGYIINDRLIRPASVVVSSGKAK